MAANSTESPVNTELKPNPSSSPGASAKPSVYLQDAEELKKVFDRFDTDGDGKISVAEMDNALRTLGSGVPPEELRRVMKDLDKDHDGFINLLEFEEFCRSSTSDGGESELQEAFNLYDQDKNGLISAAELHLVLNRLGLKCSVEECRKMIKSVDSDGDGNVNFHEFKKMMTNNPINGAT